MNTVYITGAGLVSEAIGSLSDLIGADYNDLAAINPKHINASPIDEYRLRSAKRMAKEDLSMLNSLSKIAVDASSDAVELHRKYYGDVKDTDTVPVFSASDNSEINYTPFSYILDNYSSDEGVDWSQLGTMKESINPLGVLRFMTTNTIYHLSKLFEFRGGGYPVNGMSLSGMLALQGSFLHLQRGYANNALVCANANMAIPENQAFFLKLDMVKQSQSDDGIVPAYSSAAVFLSSDGQGITKENAIAEIIDVQTLYKGSATITVEDWLSIYSRLSNQIDQNNLTILMYDNGSRQYKESELKAIANQFPNAQLISYKPITGYTGKANNLTDLVLALTDERIDEGQTVLVNGVGMTYGIGYTLLRKLRHVK